MGKFIDLTGKRFGKIKVLRRAKNSKQGQALWKCKCRCGEVITVCGASLRQVGYGGAGCSRCVGNRLKDLTGKRIGELKVLRRANNTKQGQAQWKCRCSKCGRKFITDGARLRTIKNYGKFGCSHCAWSRPQTVENLAGKVFGKLTVMKRAVSYVARKKKYVRWDCRCSCGRHVVVRSSALKRRQRSCFRCRKTRGGWERGVGGQRQRAAKWDNNYLACNHHPERRCWRSQFIKTGLKTCSKCGRSNRPHRRQIRANRWDTTLVTCTKHPHKRVNRSVFVTSGCRRCSVCWNRRAGLRGRVYARNYSRAAYWKNPEKRRKQARDDYAKHAEQYAMLARKRRRQPWRSRLQLARLVERADRMGGKNNAS